MNARADVAGAHSKALTANPKDLFGAKKVSISKLPAIAVLHGAHAMMDGARKYGPYNWRDKKVVAGIYVDAAMRHIQAWFEGEENASDSGVHHLGHAIACCAILLDARETGNLIDDRPGLSDAFGGVMAKLNDAIGKKFTETELLRQRADEVDNGLAASVAAIRATSEELKTGRKPGEFRVGDKVRFKQDESYYALRCRTDTKTVHVVDKIDDAQPTDIVVEPLVYAGDVSAYARRFELVEPAK
jgi:hypothetical protein